MKLLSLYAIGFYLSILKCIEKSTSFIGTLYKKFCGAFYFLYFLSIYKYSPLLRITS